MKNQSTTLGMASSCKIFPGRTSEKAFGMEEIYRGIFVNNQQKQEEKQENQLIWGWQPDRILLKSSTSTSPKFWKFRKPVPPPVALFIELLSASASGQSIFDANTFNCPDLSSSGSVVKSVKIK